jgi:hypothetical protein
VLDQGCTAYVKSAVDAAIAAVPGSTFASFVTTNPYSVPAWKTLLDESDPAQITTPSSVPLLMIQGGSDAQIPAGLGQYLQSHECSIGQLSQRWEYSGQSHAGVISPSYGDMLTWIGDRFAGRTLPDPYVPTAGGDSSITITQTHCSVTRAMPPRTSRPVVPVAALSGRSRRPPPGSLGRWHAR